MNKCPFCLEPIKKLTEWYYWDKKNKIIACRDKNSRGFKYRILVVKYGKENHRPKELYSEEEQRELEKVLLGIVHAHEKQGRGKYVGMDKTHFKIKKHYHIQGNVN